MLIKIPYLQRTHSFSCSSLHTHTHTGAEVCVIETMYIWNQVCMAICVWRSTWPPPPKQQPCRCSHRWWWPARPSRWRSRTSWRRSWCCAAPSACGRCGGPPRTSRQTRTWRSSAAGWPPPCTGTAAPDREEDYATACDLVTPNCHGEFKRGHLFNGGLHFGHLRVQIRAHDLVVRTAKRRLYCWNLITI